MFYLKRVVGLLFLSFSSLNPTQCNIFFSPYLFFSFLFFSFLFFSFLLLSGSCCQSSRVSRRMSQIFDQNAEEGLWFWVVVGPNKKGGWIVIKGNNIHRESKRPFPSFLFFSISHFLFLQMRSFSLLLNQQRSLPITKRFSSFSFFFLPFFSISFFPYSIFPFPSFLFPQKTQMDDRLSSIVSFLKKNWKLWLVAAGLFIFFLLLGLLSEPWKELQWRGSKKKKKKKKKKSENDIEKGKRSHFFVFFFFQFFFRMGCYCHYLSYAFNAC